jgi:hypothetical protein
MRPINARRGSASAAARSASLWNAGEGATVTTFFPPFCAPARRAPSHVPFPLPPFRHPAARVVDPAAFLRIQLDPSLRSLTPSHWAFELVNAILDGDSDFIRLAVTSAAKKWDPRAMIEPLGPEGQNLLHVAALMNRPEIVCAFLESAEATMRESTEQQRRSVRYESVVTKTSDDSHTRIVKLAKELDQIERVSRTAAAAPYSRDTSVLAPHTPFPPSSPIYPYLPHYAPPPPPLPPRSSTT